jgi:hypothetical protein
MSEPEIQTKSREKRRPRVKYVRTASTKLNSYGYIEREIKRIK